MKTGRNGTKPAGHKKETVGWGRDKEKRTAIGNLRNKKQPLNFFV